ncbi:MAG: nucleoside phosphorylase [Deltaproteobacteria bacterium]|nr:nucleoside phosphorylase [Deltaproteobacteria bacterium]
MEKKSDIEEGIIRAMKRNSDPMIGGDVIMAMIPSGVDYLIQTDKSGATHYNMGIFHLYRVKGDSIPDIHVAGPFLGAPHAVMGMEKLIALGVKRIWVTGWCGSLDPELRIGDLVIPSSAVSEEGTSAHYPIDGDIRITSGMSDVLEQCIFKKGYPFKKGVLWTTDAPYRETPEKIRYYQAKGVIAVEMEMSALMTVSLFRGVELGGVLVVSDELFDLKWKPGFSNAKLQQGSRTACDLLMDLVQSSRDCSHF